MKPRGYPLTIKIGKRDYHIVFMQSLKENVGMFDSDGDVIYLALDQSADELEATFWHEILHAFEREFGVKLGHPKIRKLEYALRDISRAIRGVAACKCKGNELGSK